MKCHFERVKGMKVLIPGCAGTAVHHDISFCTCPDSEKTLEQRVEKLERIVNELLKKMRLENILS